MMFSVGQRLRQARQDQGLALDDVVARTKISEKFLKAIESDDRQSFPSGFFYKSFVDQYAKALSLDTREIDAEIDRALSAEAPLPLPGQNNTPAKMVSPLVSAPRVARMRMYTSLAAFALVLVGCSAFYGWWYKSRTHVAAKSLPTVDNTPRLPPDAPRPPQQDPKPAEPASVPVSLATAQQPTADGVPAMDAKQQTSVSKVLLELLAREETWLSVSSDGLMVFKGTLAPHEAKTIEAKEFAKLRVNNPAALDVRLNGRPLGQLGAPGQYMVVVFTGNKFHVESEKESD